MYGDNTAQLRDALGTIMQITRNDPGVDDLPAEAVELVGSFRHGITAWCQQAVRASNPNAQLGGTTPRTRGPAEELGFRLEAAHSELTAPLPSLTQLATPHENHVVDMWRNAAQAAALGEHDFPAGLTYGHLTEPQAMTILKDASEVTRALAGIDRRYADAPGWERLTEGDLLGRAAVVCAAHAGYTAPDYGIDRRGWHPPVRLADGPVLSGIGGVLQAQNNLLVRLRYQPDGNSLRLILDSQRIVSHHAANLPQTVPEGRALCAKWTERVETYTLLVDQTRNLRGLVGHGVAAAEGALAASRIRNLTPDAPVDAGALRHLDALFTHIDRRVAETIAAGADDRSYLMRVGIPRIDFAAAGPIKEQRARHIPLDVPKRYPVLETAKNKLMPASDKSPAPTAARPSREAFTHGPKGARPLGPAPSNASNRAL